MKKNNIKSAEVIEEPILNPVDKIKEIVNV